MANLVEEKSITSDGLNLFLRTFPTESPRATVALLHGFGEHAGRYTHVAHALSKKGFEPWTMDLRGHGRSEGPRAFVASFDEHTRDLGAFIAYVRKERPNRPLFLVAHSMGGCIATLYVIQRGSSANIDGLVLSAPALKLGTDFNPVKIAVGRALGKFLPGLPIEKLKAESISRDPDVVRAYDADPLVFRGWVKTGFGRAFIEATEEVARGMDQVKVPLYVMQGEGDKIINQEGGRELHARASSADKKLVTYPGLYHEIFNEPEKDKVLGDLVAWLEAHLDATASRSRAN
jgi:acylglycerol lipase